MNNPLAHVERGTTARWPFILALVATGSGSGYYAHEQVVDHLRERIADVRNEARDRYEDLMQRCGAPIVEKHHVD